MDTSNNFSRMDSKNFKELLDNDSTKNMTSQVNIVLIQGERLELHNR